MIGKSISGTPFAPPPVGVFFAHGRAKKIEPLAQEKPFSAGGCTVELSVEAGAKPGQKAGAIA
jgi:hypothetical protein